MTSRSKKWCPCNKFPAYLCDQWPACVDINGATWENDPQFQKYRRKKNVVATDRADGARRRMSPHTRKV